MKTVLELFLIATVPEGFHVVRKEIDLTQEQRDPDLIADEYLRFLFSDSRLIADSERYILHSTSWRYEKSKKIVLTYIVYADSFSFAHMDPGLLRTGDIVVASTVTPKIPRPPVITQKAVLSHALRHLAFLMATDKNRICAQVISEETKARFIALDQELAGRISS